MNWLELLMGNTGMNLPVFSPTGLGGGGQSDDGDDVEDVDDLSGVNDIEDDGDDADDAQDGDSDADDEITLDGISALDQLFKSDDEDDDDDDDSGYDGPSADEMTQQMTASIDRYTVSESDIPEDFNINNRSELAALLTDLNRRAIHSALGTMLQPVNHTLKHMKYQIDRDMKAAVSGGLSGDKQEAALIKAVPAAANPSVRKTIETLVVRSRKMHPKNPVAAGNAVKNAMVALGMKTAGHKVSGKGRKTGGLDLYAPMVAPPSATQKTRARLKS